MTRSKTYKSIVSWHGTVVAKHTIFSTLLRTTDHHQLIIRILQEGKKGGMGKRGREREGERKGEREREKGKKDIYMCM